jgi:hypothetical protein
MTNLFIAAKKAKNLLKNRNEPETKNLPEIIFVFSQTLKVRKTPDMNSLNSKELFDTNIVHFSCLNQFQRHDSLSTVGIQ